VKQSSATAGSKRPLGFGGMSKLREVFAHPSLLANDASAGSKRPRSTGEGSVGTWQSMNKSGKLIALKDLLESAGFLFQDPMTAKLLQKAPRVGSKQRKLRSTKHRKGSKQSNLTPSSSSSRILIFSQLHSVLDAVETFVLRHLHPSHRWIRIDGSMPGTARGKLANQF